MSEAAMVALGVVFGMGLSGASCFLWGYAKGLKKGSTKVQIDRRGGGVYLPPAALRPLLERGSAYVPELLAMIERCIERWIEQETRARAKRKKPKGGREPW